MAILKLICQGCRERFDVDNDRIRWRARYDRLSRVDYRVVYCSYCGYANYIDYIEQFRREEE